MTYQTQILGSQAEGDAASASLSAVQVQKQLAIAQEQSIAAQKSVGSLNNQLGVMREQLEITDRPWITVKITACTECGPRDIRGGPLSFDGDGRGRLTYNIALDNTGKSVASRVYVRSKALAIGLDAVEMNTPLNEQKNLCSGPNLYANNKLPFDERQTIFPNAPNVTSVVTGFDTKQIRDMPEFQFTRGKPVQPFVVGCVDYEYATSSINHQTGFIYQVFGGKTHQGIQIRDTVPVDSLTFEPYFLGQGGNYAN